MEEGSGTGDSAGVKDTTPLKVALRPVSEKKEANWNAGSVDAFNTPKLNVVVPLEASNVNWSSIAT